MTTRPVDAVELWPEPERDRRAGVAAALADAEAKVLALADDTGLHRLARRGRAASRRGCRGRTAPAGRAPWRGSSVSAEPGTIASIRVTGARSSSSSTASACEANARRERLQASGSNREAGGGAMAAEALQMLRARAERAVQVEGRRSSGPSPSSRRRPGDQDDGPVEALDQPRGDDPDDAFMPVLAPDHVAPAAALRLGPGLDSARPPVAGSCPPPPAARG